MAVVTMMRTTKSNLFGIVKKTPCNEGRTFAYAGIKSVRAEELPAYEANVGRVFLHQLGQVAEQNSKRSLAVGRRIGLTCLIFSVCRAFIVLPHISAIHAETANNASSR